MKQIVGEVVGELTYLVYDVQWDSETGEVEIQKPKSEGGWHLAKEKATSKEDAMKIAQNYLDTNPNIY